MQWSMRERESIQLVQEPQNKEVKKITSVSLIGNLKKINII